MGIERVAIDARCPAQLRGRDLVDGLAVHEFQKRGFQRLLGFDLVDRIGIILESVFIENTPIQFRRFRMSDRSTYYAEFFIRIHSKNLVNCL